MKLPFRPTTPPEGFTKWFLIAAAVVAAALFVWVRMYSTVTVEMGGEKFITKIADSNFKRAKGLGGSSPLQKNEAMLFIFQEKGIRSFWMKGMTYPIDIIWFTDGAIVDIAPRVPPPTTEIEAELPTYIPRLPVDRVIEVPAGTADRLHLKIGDQIKILGDQQ